jgi:hypothetical protein
MQVRLQPALPFLCLLFVLFWSHAALASGGSGDHATAPPSFISRIEDFPREEAAAGIKDTAAKLAFRANEEPFLAVATIIFLLAILHTFVAVPISKLAHSVQHEHEKRYKEEHAALPDGARGPTSVSFRATVLHFLGEVEAIFGIWVVVLLAAMYGFYGLDSIISYLTVQVHFTEPMFVAVIMALASTRPVLKFADNCLSLFARAGKQTPAAWWLSILVIGPLFGSLITEPGAMTICAILLARKFYKLKPSPAFAYATIGLLFVNVSVGGVLTNFAAPPVLMVARKWDLTTPEMLIHFGSKAAVGILLSTLLYFVFFRKELRQMRDRAVDHDGDGLGDVISTERPIPLFVTLTHIGFMAWTVLFSHVPPLYIGGFLFFLAFSQATAHHQHVPGLRGPLMVGFFLAALVIHGGLQGWWLSPVIASLSQWPLFTGATILTSFNDNAAITFLASQAEGLTPELKYAVLAGAVTGGGLTVIANAPNPAGQAILSRFFGDGVSPLWLAAGAFLPTLVVAACMMLLPSHDVKSAFDTATPETSHRTDAPPTEPRALPPM